MRILNINTNLNGGAGKAAKRMHDLLLSNDHESKLLVRFGCNDKTNNVVSISKRNSSIIKIFTVLKRKILFYNKYCTYEVNDGGCSSFRAKVKSLDFFPDLIILHWVSGFVSLDDISWLVKEFDCKIVWYSLDMAPFTSGCHYSWGCDSYKTGCNDCPAAKSFVGKYLVSSHAETKKSLFKRHDIHLITPNNYVYNQALNSNLNFANIYNCYLPIDNEIFSFNVNKSFGQDIKILFSAADFNNARKGLKEFVKVIEKLALFLKESGQHFNVSILIPGADSSIQKLFPVQCDITPYAKSDEQLAIIYSKVDIFVSTSLEDSGPMMVAESMMSGLVVFSFDIGIAKDIIVNGVNGYSSPLSKIDDMAFNLISYLQLNSEEKKQMSINARESVHDIMSNENHKQTLNNILKSI